MPVWKGIPGLLAASGLAALGFLTAAKAQVPSAPVARLVAETDNLQKGPDRVRIEILAWSTDADRRQFVDAWNLVLPVRTGARGAGAPARGGGRRGARGGAAAGAPESPAPDPPPAAPARGRGAPGGRGGPPAGAIAPPPAAPDTPHAALASVLQSATGVGYLWSSESVGYSLRYAYRMTGADGGVRVVLATDRRLGGLDNSWTPASGAANDYAFSIIELRLNSSMEGEGKTSLTGKVSIDTVANTIALEDYAALPLTLKRVRPAPAY
jgi:hypothetical protein